MGGLVRVGLSAGRGSLAVFFAAAAPAPAEALAGVAGQYPGPVSDPSLRAIRTTLKSLVSDIAEVVRTQIAGPLPGEWLS
jgi:hypothetical protein